MPTGRRKLLLADDSPTVQKVVSLTFDDEGFEVVAVATGAHAVAELERGVPDIVLADVHMPAPDGYELCARIKRDARTSHVPVVLLVGAFEPFDEAEARKSGADEVLTKPFQSIRELVNKVGGLLGGQPEAKKPDEREEEDEPTGELRTANAVDARATEARSDAPHSASSNDERARASAATPAFANFDMDDENIETMPADEFAARQSAPASQDFDESRVSFDERNADEFSTSDATSARSSAGGAQSFAAAASHTNYATGFDARADAAAAADDALLELGDIDSSRSSDAASDDFVLDIGDDEGAYASTRTTPPRESAMPESLYADDVPSAVEMQAAGSVSMAEPSAVWDAAQEFAVSPDAITEQVEAPAHPEPEATAQSFDEGTRSFDDTTTRGAVEMFDEPAAHEPTAAKGATLSEPQASTQPPPAQEAGASQLSPETIDAIARRVVEHLSERVVREIAWEVVPELAERLIRRKLEEEQARAK